MDGWAVSLSVLESSLARFRVRFSPEERSTLEQEYMPIKKLTQLAEEKLNREAA